MRPLWTGALSFGLVNIPVGLYTAIRHKATVDLDLLRDSDHSRIRYKKVAEADGQEVPKEHILKGFEYEKDQYIVLTDKDFKRVQIKSTQTIDVTEFVSLSEVEPLFFDQPYFLAPQKVGAKAYALLRAALERTGLAGVAKVVIRPPREHLAMVKPLNGILVLETMHFADELGGPAELHVPQTPVGKKELDMAISLVKAMATRWEPKKYHDEYRECLMKVIQQKAKAGSQKLPEPKTTDKPAPGKVIDLVQLLQESLGQSGRRQKSKPGRQRAGHKKAA